MFGLRDAGEVHEILEVLATDKLIVKQGRELWRFQHATHQEVAYGRILLAQRFDFHLSIAKKLQKVFGSVGSGPNAGAAFSFRVHPAFCVCCYAWLAGNSSVCLFFFFFLLLFLWQQLITCTTIWLCLAAVVSALQLCCPSIGRVRCSCQTLRSCLWPTRICRLHASSSTLARSMQRALATLPRRRRCMALVSCSWE